MILAESVALGLVGATVGGALGILVVALTHERGLDFAEAVRARFPSPASPGRCASTRR
jgi:ABC-type antimicrobial peptide transport system permease subunit